MTRQEALGALVEAEIRLRAFEEAWQLVFDNLPAKGHITHDDVNGGLHASMSRRVVALQKIVERLSAQLALQDRIDRGEAVQ